MKAFLVASVLLMLVHFETYYAKVIGIHDGDSITVLNESNLQIKIRLDGIDCPELKQDFGTKARQYTSTLCFNKQVIIKKTGTDRYGRTLALVYVGRLCLNTELVRVGLAWHYKKYNKEEIYSKFEKHARLNKMGLWSHNNPIPPWEFRRK
jgi:micrococcal nuclease